MPAKDQTCFKSRCLLIPLIVFIVAILGSIFTSWGMDWYQTLKLPENVASGRIISIAWTLIYIFSAIAVLLVFETKKRDKKFKCIIKLFIINAVLNVLWTLFFFVAHWILVALILIIFLEISTIALIILIWPRCRWAAILFLPYALWLIVAIYYNIQIWLLN